VAEDLFQETWVRVLERGGQYDGRREFGPWLFAIARNLFIDQRRRTHDVGVDSPDLPTSGQPSAFDLTMRDEQHKRVDAAMRSLAAEYREALVLRFQDEMSLQEIANVTGAPLSTVKSRVYRGLSALGQLLKGGGL
jgi:RNA polymerase sigma-70 factor (ECF subfamily)